MLYNITFRYIIFDMTDNDAYRVDIEKAVNLILCVRPRICYVNGLFGSGKTYFTEKFKSEGFNVLSLDKIYARINGSSADMSYEQIQDTLVNEIRTHLQRFEGSIPVIVEGFMRDPEILHKIFTEEFELFTYIYMYPNNAKRYKERLLQTMEDRGWSFEYTPYSFPPYILNEKELSVLRKSGKGANTVVRKLIEINRDLYGAHLEAFDSHIFTVLN